MTTKQAWPQDPGTRDMGGVPLPAASGSRGKGTARCVWPLSTQDKDLVEEGGERKTPGKPGHSDLITKSIFSGKAKSISTLTCYGLEQLGNRCGLADRTGPNGERAGG